MRSLSAQESDYKIGFGFINDLTCKLPLCLPGIQLRLLEVELDNPLLLLSLNSDISFYAFLIFSFLFYKNTERQYH